MNFNINMKFKVVIIIKEILRKFLQGLGFKREDFDKLTDTFLEVGVCVLS